MDAACTGSIASVPPPSIRPKEAPSGASDRIVQLGADGLAAEHEQERFARALAAAGQRAQVGRQPTGALEPAADRAGDLGRAERAPERAGRDQHGALRPAQHRIRPLVQELLHRAVARLLVVAPAR